MRPAYSRLPGRQRGITLVIALIFLVLLSMLGATVALNNSLQERMAGNTRQRDLAFQATEHALKAAETALSNSASAESIYIQNVIALHPAAATATKPSYVSLNGEGHDNDANYWKNTFDWTTTASTAVVGIASDLVDANPRYIVEQMPTLACSVPSPCPDGRTTGYNFYYRITAHGVGKDPKAEVVLQTMYKFQK